MITPTAVSIRWERVAGSSRYEILRDGTRVSGTKSALTAKLGVLEGGHVWTVRAQPSGTEQSLDMRLGGSL